MRRRGCWRSCERPLPHERKCSVEAVASNAVTAFAVTRAAQDGQHVVCCSYKGRITHGDTLELQGPAPCSRAIVSRRPTGLLTDSGNTSVVRW